MKLLFIWSVYHLALDSVFVKCEDEINFQVLSHFYDTTNGGSWSNKDNWMVGYPCSSAWKDVTCSGTSILSVNMNSNNVVGSLPSELGYLTSLTELFFYANPLTGHIPSQFGLLTAMSTMILSSQSLDGTFPSQLGELTRATKMSFFGNLLSSSIPSQLGRLTNMVTEFEFQENLFVGTVPSQLGLLTKMTSVFSLGDNALTGLIPSQLGALTLMTTSYNLYTNSFCGDIPSELTALSTSCGCVLVEYSNDFLGTPCPVSTLSPTLTVVPSPVPTMFTRSPTFIPSFGPSITPTILTLPPTVIPSSVPTRIPTPAPSRIPYPFPSFRPSPSPTGVPISAPTFLPTLIPTTLPTDIPSSAPSFLPSFIPTSLPTDIPSSSPTTTPTVTPTLRCDAGTYYDGFYCLDCPIGHFSNVTDQPSNCSQCPEGQYNTETGLKACEDCASGKLSSSDRTYCEDCQAGEYNYENLECVECEYGKYAPQALTDSCLECGAGFHTNRLVKATSCSACHAGTFSSGSTFNCTICGIGSYSSSGASTCILCPIGLASDETGSSTCTACSAGTYSEVIGSWNCTPCAKGTYQGSTGQPVCDDCPTGTFASSETSTSCTSCDAGKYAANTSSLSCSSCSKGKFQGSTGQSFCHECSVGEYSASIGSTSCTSCDAGKYTTNQGSLSCESCAQGQYQGSTGQYLCLDCNAGTYSGATGAVLCDNCALEYDSTIAASSCQLAAEYYFLKYHKDSYQVNTTSEPCPRNADCFGLDYAPVPQKGYWVDRSLYSYAADIYACPRDTCKGADSLGACWKHQTYNQSYMSSGDDENNNCDANSLLCSEGASGLLCGSCDVGYVYRGETKACSKCGNIVKFSYAILGICALLIFIVLGIFVSYRYCGATMGTMQFKIVDSGSLKVCWVTYQIIMSISWNLDIKFPISFSRMLSFLSILSLEILSLECFQTERSVADRYYVTVYLWSIFPILFGLVIILIGVVRSVGFGTDDAITRRSILNQHIGFLLLLSYLVLPPVTMKQLRGLDCIYFPESGSSYLRADTEVDCQSEDYKVFIGVMMAFFCLYQLIPVVWMVLLYRHRFELHIPESTNEQLALQSRDTDPSLSHIRFLFKDYRGKKWWFEVAEMYRRIIFIGVLPLCTPNSSKRASLGCIFAIASFIYFREESPFQEQFTNNIACIAQITILLTFYTALSIDTGVVFDFGIGDTGIGIYLILINMLVLVLVIWLSFTRYERLRLEQEWRRPLTTQELIIVNQHLSETDKEDKIVQDKLDHDDSIEMSNPPKKQSIDQVHSRLINQYLLKPKDVVMIKRVGAGAFGEVFKGTCMGEYVAIKTMIDVTEANVREFKAEIVLTAVLRHPNIVNFVGACWGKELMCLVLEWVAKGSLRDLLTSTKSALQWNEPLLRLAIDIARGMAYLHNRSYYDEIEEGIVNCILHRDLKPDNALISDFMVAKLADFGTSRAKGEEDVMMTGVGTPFYCAPEIARGEIYDEKVDVYSFGLTLMEMCVEEDLFEFIGKRWMIAFNKKKVPKVAMRLIRPMTEDGWRPVTDENPISFAPPMINSLIVRCCSHDPNLRLSFEEILEELNGPCQEEINSNSFGRCDDPKNNLRTKTEKKEHLEIQPDILNGVEAAGVTFTNNPLAVARSSFKVLEIEKGGSVI